MAARMVTAIARTIPTVARFCFGAMYPSWAPVPGTRPGTGPSTWILEGLIGEMCELLHTSHKNATSRYKRLCLQATPPMILRPVRSPPSMIHQLPLPDRFHSFRQITSSSISWSSDRSATISGGDGVRRSIERVERGGAFITDAAANLQPFRDAGEQRSGRWPLPREVVADVGVAAGGIIP